MTLIIRIPNKLAQRVGHKNLETLPVAANPLLDWSVGFFDYGKREYLLLVNTTSLYTKLIEITPQVAGNVEQALFDEMERIYRDTPYQKNFEDFIRPERGGIVYSKALSRKITGGLNRMVFEISVQFDNDQQVDEINASINNIARATIQTAGGKYQRPSEIFAKINESAKKGNVKEKKSASGSVQSNKLNKSGAEESPKALAMTPPKKGKAKKQPARTKRKETPKREMFPNGWMDSGDDFPDYAEIRRQGAAAMRKLVQALNSGALNVNQLKGMFDVNAFLDGMPEDEPTADDLLDDAERTTNPEQVKKIVDKALKLDPKSVRAYLLLAHRCAHTIEGIKKYLEMGEKIGDELFPVGIQKDFDGNLWLLTEARPYLMLLAELATWEHHFGDLGKALALYNKVLLLSEGDNLGIRYTMIFLLIELGRDADAEKLYRHYDEESAQWLYARALLDYRKYGPTSKEALASLQRAMRENPHFAKLCASDKLFNAKYKSDCYSPGSKEEAYTLRDEGRGAFVTTEGFRKWCAQ